MSQPLLTVEQAAEKLGLHVKTVLRYIRDGRIVATKIGKSYRVPVAELNAFAGLPAATTERAATVRTTSVTEFSDIGIASAERIATFLQAAALTGDADTPALHLQTAYDPQMNALKIIVIGEPADVGRMLQMLELHVASRR